MPRIQVNNIGSSTHSNFVGANNSVKIDSQQLQNENILSRLDQLDFQLKILSKYMMGDAYPIEIVNDL